ncbi:MAG: fumarate hydratase [Oscillospiraceae bacterium]|nr:fumarate hydratase [Oscillospiraceae bacterium]
MREIQVSDITKQVKEHCILANKILPCDMECRMREACQSETSPLGREILKDLVTNFEEAKNIDVPICQDTGMAVVFVELGQEVHLVGGSLSDAINEGVAQGYVEGLLRCSVVSDPIRRVNTNNNTPAIIHMKIVEGDGLKITVAPKGFGSENMSRIKMFTPAATKEMVMDFVIETVELAGANPCPPMVVGVGIGGDFEECALLAKTALCRSSDQRNPDPLYEEMELELLRRANETNVGPQGFGGSTTALFVNIETYGTHIAGLPVAVNIGCHVTRHSSFEL